MNASYRPGGGPNADSNDLPIHLKRRNDPVIQRACYNGWKKMWQTVVLPNGMNFHVYGSVLVRENDVLQMNNPRINDSIAQLQDGEDKQFVTYGDSAYCILFQSHIRARSHMGANTVLNVYAKIHVCHRVGNLRFLQLTVQNLVNARYEQMLITYYT
jgi:hypothetical protein